ncbi:MAG: hypothetical protein KDA28_05970, partial [Phycisphaerales bacterium]|nr:hypothetical protein [Phycisphaerales bacterium]
MDIRRLLTVCGLALAASGAMAQPSNLDLTEGDYNNFLKSVRAAEYVREDFILGTVFDCDDNVVSQPGTKPRVAAVVAATLAFAEANPHADSGPEFNAFIDSYNDAIVAAFPEDSDLKTPQNFIQAVRYVRLHADATDPDLSALVGFDLNVGERALELLGLEIPEPGSFDAVQDRMMSFESSIARDLRFSPAFATLLVQAFMGLDPSNVHHSSLRTRLEVFLRSEGYDGAFGDVRPELCAVNSGLATMPQTWSEFQTAIAIPLDGDPGDVGARDIDNPYQALIVGAIDGVNLHSDTLIDEMAVLLANEPTFEESIALAQDQAYVDGVYDNVLANWRANSQSRATIFSNSLALMQGDYEDTVGNVAEYAWQQNRYGSASLGVNAKFAKAQAGVEIAKNVFLIGAAIQSGETADGVEAGFDLVNASIGLGSTCSNGVTEDDIYEQVIEMRAQLADMQTQLNQRFDRVEEKLDIMYTSMMTAFNGLGNAIGEIDANIDALVIDMYEAHSALSRLESILFWLYDVLAFDDFATEADFILDYRAGGGDLGYDSGSPIFTEHASSFFTFSTTTAGNLAGSLGSPFALTEADETIGGNATFNSYLNDLIAHAPTFGGTAIGPVVSPEGWTQGASAYAQLARTNPWYFTHLYASQEANGSDDPQLDRLIERGDLILAMTDSFRDETFFENLVINVQLAALDMQTAIDAEIDDFLQTFNPDVPLSNGVDAVDLWAQQASQDVRPIAPHLERWTTDWGNSNDDLSIPSGGTREGWRSLDRSNAGAEQIQLRTLLREYHSGEGREAYWFNGPGGGPSTNDLIVEIYQAGDPSVVEYRRTIRWVGQRWDFLNNEWDTVSFSGNGERADFVKDLWPELKQEIGSGADLTPFAFTLDFKRMIINTDTGEVVNSSDRLIANRFRAIRTDLRDHLVTELLTPSSTLYAAGEALDDAEAMLDAYATIALPNGMRYSEVLRGGLRAAPGASELGIRSDDVLQMILEIDEADEAMASGTWADPVFNVLGIGDELDHRADIILDEILGLIDAMPAEGPAYVEWMHRELTDLRDNHDRLAVDDTFEPESSYVTGNVIANDV